MDKRNLGGPMMLVWPWLKTKEAGRDKHTDATNTSPRNIPVLPLEIIDKILREACQWPLMKAERQVLTAGTLVCKSWLPLARNLLYYSLIVETTISHRSYARRKPGKFGPEELLQKSHLLEFTRSLSIRIQVFGESISVPLLSEGDCPSPEGSRKCVQIPDFIFLLAHTPRLRFLKLSVNWLEKDIGQFKPHILGWLSSLVLPVEALDLSNRGKFYNTFVHDFVGIWPTIRALRVATVHKGIPPERPSMCLRELRLPITFLATVIEWFLPPPPPDEQSSLWLLELYAITKDALPVLSVHGPSISTLILTHKPDFEFAHLFTKLEELVIAGPFWNSPLPALPRTLKHIRIQSDGMLSSVLVGILRVIPTGELPDLRVLSIEKALTAHARYPDLHEVCETHGVEILVNSVDSFGRMVHPYHVEMKRFPRQYTFSEFFDVGNRGL